MYVTPELNALVNGPWADAKQEARFSALRADLDFFVAGGLVNKGYMKPLRKRADEVWEIRSRAPSPSIRLFGRFAMPNVFIGTNWEYRSFLELFDRWRRNKRQAQAIWRQLFTNYPPYSGQNTQDYLTMNWEGNYDE